MVVTIYLIGQLFCFSTITSIYRYLCFVCTGICTQSLAKLTTQPPTNISLFQTQPSAQMSDSIKMKQNLTIESQFTSGFLLIYMLLLVQILLTVNKEQKSECHGHFLSKLIYVLKEEKEISLHRCEVIQKSVIQNPSCYQITYYD